jgi:DSBA-like thioredoxin domain-containing protein
MTIVVYADFTCLDCYLAARRADILAAAGVSVDFRAIEHRPRLPITGEKLSADDQDALTERFGVLQGLLLPGEQLPWTMPPIVAKSEAAVSAYAEVYGSHVESDVRRLLFELYWRERADIGNPNVLRTPLAGPVLRSGSDADPLQQTGYAVSVDRAPITIDAYRRIKGWRAEWQELGGPPLPVILTGGATLQRIEALRRLSKEIAYTGADVVPELPDPRRYPHVDVRPSRAWVSQIGGRWRNVYRSGGIA